MKREVLSRRLKNLREERGYLQKYVADKIGVRSNTLSGYENGTRSPDPDMLVSLANLYDVTTDYLLGKTEKPNVTEDDEKAALIEEMAKKYPDADIMFDNLAEMTVEQLREVDDFIKFKLQKKG